MKSDLEKAAHLALDSIMAVVAMYPVVLGEVFKPTISSLRDALKIEQPEAEKDHEWNEYIKLFQQSGRELRGIPAIKHSDWHAMTDISKIGHIEVLLADVQENLERQQKRAIAVKLQAEEAKAIAERPASFGAW